MHADWRLVFLVNLPVAAILFSAAFGAMLLSNVLSMTGVWHESILRAGLKLAPGPGLAAVTAVASSRLTNRAGQARLAGLGCTLFALGIALVAPARRHVAPLRERAVAFRAGWTFQIAAALLAAAAGLVIGAAGPAVSRAPAVPRGTAAGTQPG